MSSWYDPGDRHTLVKDVRTLIDFCKELDAEEKHWKTFYDKVTANLSGSRSLYGEEEKPQGRRIFPNHRYISIYTSLYLEYHYLAYIN